MTQMLATIPYMEHLVGKFGEFRRERHVTTARKLNIEARLGVDGNLRSSST